MKKMITMFAAVTVALSALAVPVSADVTYAGVEFNGVKVQFEQDPVIEEGRVLVPFRFVAEKLGANVEWDAETKTVTCEKNGLKMALTANQKDIVVSGQSVEIDVPVKILNDRVMVPLRIVADALGADVEWDAENKTVKINTVAETTTEATTETTTEDADKAKDDVASSSAVEVETYTDEDNKIEVSYPVLTGDAAALNDSLKEMAMAGIENYKSLMYKEDMSRNEYKNEVKVAFQDEKIISVVATEYLYTGGAHGNTTVSSAVYDAKTLKEKTVDSKTMAKAVAQFKEMAKDDKNEFFEDAEKDIVADNIGWYVDEEGQNVFYINDTVVAPHSAGLITTVVK